MKKTFLLLLVSSGLLFAEFSRDNSNEVVVDSKTSLMWQDNDVAYKMKWSVAIKYCQELSLANHSDWHLPSKAELDSLVKPKKYDPSIDSTFKNTISYRYWTSTTGTVSDEAAWYVNFAHGQKDGYYKTDANYVRCVRSEK